MFTAETMPGVLLGLLIIGLGTYLGVKAAKRRRDEA